MDFSSLFSSAAGEFLGGLVLAVFLAGVALVVAWLKSQNVSWARLVLDTLVGWVCLYILFYGLPTGAITSAAWWWSYVLGAGSLMFFMAMGRRRGKQIATIPAPAIEPVATEPPPPISNLLLPAQEVANRAKIAQVFRAHGKDASENIQKIAQELFEQLSRSESKERQVIVEIAQKSLFIPCTVLRNTLNHALADKRESFPMLRRYLEDFFITYFNLVLCVQEIDRLLGRHVSRDKTRIIWQEDHRRFLDDLRELLTDKDFSTSRVRMKEGQHGPSN